MNITLERGIKCRNCGQLAIPPFKHEHCRTCGAGLFRIYPDKTCIPTANAKPTMIKVTHRFFSKTLEEVK